MVTAAVLVDLGGTTKVAHPHNNGVFPLISFNKFLDQVAHAFIKAGAVPGSDGVEDPSVVIPAAQIDFDAGYILLDQFPGKKATHTEVVGTTAVCFDYACGFG